jgi:UDP-N-acetylglucosamine 4,6-dehydratase
MELFVTGATGFLGRNIIKKALKDGRYSRIYGISRRWADQEKMPKDDRLTLITGDIRDEDAVWRFFNLSESNRPCAIIHTAAFKHVPMGQRDAEECVSVNITGTANVLKEAAKRFPFGGSFVMISTDKAVQPVNVYGHTKAVAEQIVLNGYNDNFQRVVCRFGNVFGSTGSVVEKWAERVAADNPYFKITDAPMTRYWFHINDAVNYVLAGLDSATGILIPVLQSSTLPKLLKGFVSLMMPEMKQRVEVEFFPVRPGEKIHEAMTCEQELMFAEITEFQKNHLKLIHLVPNKHDEPNEYDKFKGVLSSEHAEKYDDTGMTLMVADYLRNRKGMAL